MEAIQEAQNIALEHNSMQIEQEHLVCALLEQKDGLIRPADEKDGNATRTPCFTPWSSGSRACPGSTGPGRESGKIYVSGDVDQDSGRR